MQASFAFNHAVHYNRLNFRHVQQSGRGTQCLRSAGPCAVFISHGAYPAPHMACDGSLSRPVLLQGADSCTPVRVKICTI